MHQTNNVSVTYIYLHIYLIPPGRSRNNIRPPIVSALLHRHCEVVANCLIFDTVGLEMIAVYVTLSLVDCECQTYLPIIGDPFAKSKNRFR